MRKRSGKSQDLNQVAKSIVDAVSDEPEDEQESEKNPAAVELGRFGGLKGGKARAAGMTAEERSESARKAAKARWAKRDNK